MCTSRPKPSRWRLEKPWVAAALRSPLTAIGFSPSNDFNPSNKQSLTAADAALLQWWFDFASNLMVLDLRSNPLSLPILEHLAVSPALCFALKAVSAGHKGSYTREAEVEYLENRSMALRLCRAELASNSVPLTTIFFAVLLIGISTPWMGDIDDYGKEHLMGARAILNTLLAREEDGSSAYSPIMEHILAYYAWWDMGCSFSVDPRELPPLRTLDLLSTTSREPQSLNLRFGGCMIDLYHLLGLLLRYCMEVLRSGHTDPTYEERLERKLLDWHPSRARDEEEALLSGAFQRHGLIIFYRVCRLRRACVVAADDEPWPGQNEGEEEDEEEAEAAALKAQIYQHATEIVSMILPKEINRPYLNALSIPLLTAGAELTVHDRELRHQVLETFASVYDECRNNTLYRAKGLLEELWILRDGGREISYLELMVQKGWNFTLV